MAQWVQLARLSCASAAERPSGGTCRCSVPPSPPDGDSVRGDAPALAPDRQCAFPSFHPARSCEMFIDLMFFFFKNRSGFDCLLSRFELRSFLIFLILFLMLALSFSLLFLVS